MPAGTLDVEQPMTSRVPTDQSTAPGAASDDRQPTGGSRSRDRWVAGKRPTASTRLPLAENAGMERALLRWETEGGNLGPQQPGSDDPEWPGGREQNKLDVRVKRVYAPATSSDGYRVLVDRLWPRGVSRSEAALNEWAKSLAPSEALRVWFGHDPARFPEFRRRYGRELRGQQSQLAVLRHRARLGPLTLVYAARDEQHNGAVVLADILQH